MSHAERNLSATMIPDALDLDELAETLPETDPAAAAAQPAGENTGGKRKYRIPPGRKKINMWVDEETVDWVRTQAEREKVPMKQIVEDCLVEEMARQERGEDGHPAAERGEDGHPAARVHITNPDVSIDIQISDTCQKAVLHCSQGVILDVNQGIATTIQHDPAVTHIAVPTADADAEQ